MAKPMTFTLKSTQMKITHCVAMPTAALVYFSERFDRKAAIDPANYSVWAHSGTSRRPVQVTFKDDAYDHNAKAVSMQLHAQPPLKVGDQLSIQGMEILLSDGSTTAETDPIFVRVNGEAKASTRDVEDAVSYPILTEEVSYRPSPVGIPTGGAGGITGAGTGNLGQVAAQAVSDVLGWKTNVGDPKGFLGALTQSFTLQDVEGHIESAWTPRTYAVQTDLAGGITGAQASLYKRAEEALTESLPLLEGLYALNPDSDAEMVTALKDLAKSQFTELVNEMALPGGPRISRVNQYFKLLLGQNFPIKKDPAFNVVSDPDSVQGTIGNLRRELQLQSFSHYINTVEDEQDVTNYRILSDYVTSLAQSWVNNIQFFGLGTNKAFLGSQLVLLSRQLSTIVDTVAEVRFTMDSVFIGPSERQTVELRFANGEPPLFIEDLLSWVEGFAKDEGPQLIRDAGKLGVGEGFLPVVDKLIGLVKAAKTPTNTNIPDGYRTRRVQNSLDDLANQLVTLKDLAKDLEITKPPIPFDEDRMMNKVKDEIHQEVNRLKDKNPHLKV